jgi:hypothetical protein
MKLQYERQLRSEESTNENPLALDCLDHRDRIGMDPAHIAVKFPEACWATTLLRANNLSPFTGGTGKFACIRGATRTSADFDPSPGGVVSDLQISIEYSTGK